MKEYPVLFSASMVRAILAGTKTQTRRALRDDLWLDPELGVIRMSNVSTFVTGFQQVACPYGRPGDQLWVREAWGYFDPNGSGEDYDGEQESSGPGHVAHCDELLQEGHPLRSFWRRRIAYKATFAEDKYGNGPVGPKKWRPSIHMPRWACRIKLEITDIRVERLQGISAADAWAEGIPHSPDVDPVHEFQALWESINGAESWAANPWVWCVGFRRLEA